MMQHSTARVVAAAAGGRQGLLPAVRSASSASRLLKNGQTTQHRAIAIHTFLRRNASTKSTGGTAGNTATEKLPGVTDTSTTITLQDVQNLQSQLQTLQQLLQQSRSQAFHLESLTRNLTARTFAVEQELHLINQNVSKIGGMEQILQTALEKTRNNPALKALVHNLENVLQQSRPFVENYKYYLAAIFAASVVIWKYRATLVYQRTSEEVADLAKRTLEQVSLRNSIQETLHTLANNPQTLHTLNELIQELIQDHKTQQQLIQLVVIAVQSQEVQAALLDLLQIVFKNPQLQELTGEFLLKGLDMEPVKTMLDEQTAALVQDTLSNDAVQQATATGIKRSLWYAVTPSFLWRYMERTQVTKSDKDNKNSTSKNGEKREEQSTKGKEQTEGTSGKAINNTLPSQ